MKYTNILYSLFLLAGLLSGYGCNAASSGRQVLDMNTDWASSGAM